MREESLLKKPDSPVPRQNYEQGRAAVRENSRGVHGGRATWPTREDSRGSKMDTPARAQEVGDAVRSAPRNTQRTRHAHERAADENKGVAMVQSINWPAIRLVPRVLFRQPALALPHMEVSSVADLDFRCLRAAGCAGVIFDKDNTLTDPYGTRCIRPRHCSGGGAGSFWRRQCGCAFQLGGHTRRSKLCCRR